MSKNQLIFVTCAFALALCGHVALASESQGIIENGFNLTKICKTIDCSSYGNVNWKPTLNANTTGAVAVTITDSSITGYLWGDEIGWVNLQPTGYGVTVNPNTGALSGYAYANVGSWINFSPTSVSGGTPVGVSINAQGQFTGWAYVSGINGGWMEFDCSLASTCMQTDWRPVPSRTASSNPSNSSTGSGSSFSSGGSTPERRAADLASIWAYNTIQPTPPTTASPASSVIVTTKNTLNSQSGGQAGTTTLQAHGKNQNLSPTPVSPGGSPQPTLTHGLLQSIMQSPVTKMLAGIVVIGLIFLLIRVLLL
jgi:hypothetical protein